MMGKSALVFAAAVLVTATQAHAAFRQVFDFSNLTTFDGHTALADPISLPGTYLGSPDSTVYGYQYYDPNLNPVFTSTFPYHLVSNGTVSIWHPQSESGVFDMIQIYYAPAYVNGSLSFDMIGTHRDGTTVTRHVDAASADLTSLTLDATFSNLIQFDIVDAVGTGAYDDLVLAPHYTLPPSPPDAPLPSAPALVLPLLAGVPLLGRKRRS